MKLAIASGKGGTGKSMVAANLAYTLSRTEPVTLVDCDVEEPNLHLFFPAPATTTEVTVPVPVVDETTCQHCGLCEGVLPVWCNDRAEQTGSSSFPNSAIPAEDARWSARTMPFTKCQNG